MKQLKKRFLSIFVYFMYLFLYIPIIVLVVYSFNSGGFPGAWKGFSLQWYIDLFYSKGILQALKHSTIIALASSFISVFLSLCIVYGGQSYAKFLPIFYANNILPDIILAVGLMITFSYFSIPFGLLAVIIGHSILSLAFCVPIIKNRMDELNRYLVEASLDLGATKVQTFFYIILPFLSPALLSSFLLGMIVSFDDLLIAFFCSGSSYQTLSLYIFSMIRSGISPTVNALSTVMLLLSIITVLLMNKMNKKNVIYHDKK